MPASSLSHLMTRPDAPNNADAELTLLFDGTVVTATGDRIASIECPSVLRSIAQPVVVCMLCLAAMILIVVQFVAISKSHPAYWPTIVAMLLVSLLAVNYTTALGGRCPYLAVSTRPPFSLLFTMPRVTSWLSLIPRRELLLANGEVVAHLHTRLTRWRATDPNGHVLLTAGTWKSYWSMVRSNIFSTAMQPTMELRDHEDRPCGEFFWHSDTHTTDVRCPAECVDAALAMAIIIRETYLRKANL